MPNAQGAQKKGRHRNFALNVFCFSVILSSNPALCETKSTITIYLPSDRVLKEDQITSAQKIKTTETLNKLQRNSSIIKKFSKPISAQLPIDVVTVAPSNPTLTPLSSEESSSLEITNSSTQNRTKNPAWGATTIHRPDSVSNESVNENKPIGLSTLPPLTFSDSAQSAAVTVGASQSSVYATDENSIFRLTTGAGYLSKPLNQTSAVIEVSRMTTKSTAVGARVDAGNNRQEIISSLVTQTESGKWLNQVSFGYLRGKQPFNFYSGIASANLSQTSALLSSTYRLNEGSQTLKSIGLKIWGSRANQGSNLDVVTVTQETTNTIDTYLDPRKLSEGRLAGASINVRLVPLQGLTLNPRAGNERLKFPYFDSTSEKITKDYLGLNVDYQSTNGVHISGDVFLGAAERSTSIKFGYAQWALGLYRVYGQQGLDDTYGAGITYTSQKGSPKYLESPLTLNANNRPFDKHNSNSRYSNHELLTVAAQRPTEFPRTFLAKVDSTAVRLVSSTAKVTLAIATTGSQGVYFDTGTPRRTAISFPITATASNGGAVTYAWGSDPGNLQSKLSLNTNTGVISGSHPAVAVDTVYSFTIIATSGSVSSTSGTLTLTVMAPVRVRFTRAGAATELGTSVNTSNSITFPAQLTSLELFMVGGGGGGGYLHGGGGGGGTVVTASGYSVTGGSTYAVSVGSGGTGGTSLTFRGTDGGATTIGALAAAGGGGGGGGAGGFERGNSGGSAGGISFLNPVVGPVAAAANCGTTSGVVSYFCNASGDESGAGFHASGGGGAGSAGGNKTAGAAGNGGAGYTLGAGNFTGGVYGAGGGGGANASSGVDSTGGSGVGGGGSHTGVGSNAIANTGSGGGGGAENAGGHAGGNGSDGIIFLRY